MKNYILPEKYFHCNYLCKQQDMKSPTLAFLLSSAQHTSGILTIKPPTVQYVLRPYEVRIILRLTVRK